MKDVNTSTLLIPMTTITMNEYVRGSFLALLQLYGSSERAGLKNSALNGD